MTLVICVKVSVHVSIYVCTWCVWRWECDRVGEAWGTRRSRDAVKSAGASAFNGSSWIRHSWNKVHDYLLLICSYLICVHWFKWTNTFDLSNYCFYSYENDCIVDNLIRQNIRSHILVSIIIGGETRECYSFFKIKLVNVIQTFNIKHAL